MIRQIIEKAADKVGSQNKLAEKIGLTSGRISEFKNYKTGDKRKPNDETILKIADILGLDKGETLYKAKLELEPEQAYLWEWCARRDSNTRPSASEVMGRLLLNMVNIILLVKQHQYTGRNLNARNAWSIQYHHAPANP